MLEEKKCYQKGRDLQIPLHTVTSQKTRLHNVHALENSNFANSIMILTPATSNKLLNYLDLEHVNEKDF
jgi:hypothetical protein